MNISELFTDRSLRMLKNYLCAFSRKHSSNTVPLKFKIIRVDFKLLAGASEQTIKGTVFILAGLVASEGGNMSAK